MTNGSIGKKQAENICGRRWALCGACWSGRKVPSGWQRAIRLTGSSLFEFFDPILYFAMLPTACMLMLPKQVP